MVRVVRYKDEYKVEWNRFCKSSKNGIFLYEREYMEYHKDRFEDFSLMFYDDENEKLIGILPANITGTLVNSHGGLTFGGLVIDSNTKQHSVIDCFDCMLSLLREWGVTTLRYKHVPHVYHKHPAEEDIYALYRFNASLVKVEASTVVDMKNTIKMAKGRKAQISRAKREGVEVLVKEDLSDYIEFIELENKALERHNATAVHTAEELKRLRDSFPGNIHLFGGYYHGEMIAATVIYEHDNVIHTQYMAANNTARELGALDLIIKTIIDKYSEEKKWLDFGISTENDGKYLNEGLIAQKEGFGGRTNVFTTWEITV